MPGNYAPSNNRARETRARLFTPANRDWVSGNIGGAGTPGATGTQGTQGTQGVQGVPGSGGPAAPIPTGDITADTVALQAFLDAAPTGSQLQFGPYEWVVNAVIKYPAGLRLQGTMFRVGTGTRIKMADGANLDAVLASSLWYSASATPTSAIPTHISHFHINGNKANQTSGLGHGLVMMNFQSQIEFIIAQDCRGDGIRATGETLAGNGITNTANEINIERCQVRSCNGNGIYIHEHDTAAKLTDGWITNCIVSSILEAGIRIDGAAGWFLGWNHTYGTEKSGYRIQRGFRLRMIGNYAESYGDSATVGSYAGIDLFSAGMVTAGPCQISGNIVSASDTPAVGTTLRGIAIRTLASSSGYVSVTSNGIYGRTSATPTTGLNVTNVDGTATTYLSESGNIIIGWDIPITVSTTIGVMIVGSAGNTGQARVATTTFSATPTISPSAVAAAFGVYMMTLTNNITTLTIGNGADGQRMTLNYTQDGVGSRTIAWPANVINPPTITATAGAVTSVNLLYIGANTLWYRV